MTKPNSSPVPSPKGTRDLYPDQYLRQNYITRLWRDTALRHGFEEINGPTFEMLELYTRKSGEGIVSELFRFRREGGETDYALRPEFTPTLARMYAAKAASLPSPTKWFSIGPYFRAEKPQRGRLREFLQWNVDVLGGTSPLPPNEADNLFADSDATPISMIVDCLMAFGLSEANTQVAFSDRTALTSMFLTEGISSDLHQSLFSLLDRAPKLTQTEVQGESRRLGIDPWLVQSLASNSVPDNAPQEYFNTTQRVASAFGRLFVTKQRWQQTIPADWLKPDPTIVRGLAYYTGTVFEVIAEGERAIAGGGRYDNLIELFGGPPTPAVGFGMGDVVLGLLLDDKGLMPTGAELMDALSRPGASLRPEAFVVAGSEDEDALVEPLLANLRRGVERDGFDGKPWAADRYAVRPMHARRTYKTTRNLKKLLNDAEKQHARYFVELHGRDGSDKVELRDMDSRQSLTPNLVPGWDEEPARAEEPTFSLDPASPVYVGAAIARILSEPRA